MLPYQQIYQALVRDNVDWLLSLYQIIFGQGGPRPCGFAGLVRGAEELWGSASDFARGFNFYDHYLYKAVCPITTMSRPIGRTKTRVDALNRSSQSFLIIFHFY